LRLVADVFSGCVLDFAVHDVDSSWVLTFLAKAKPPIAVVFEPEASPPPLSGIFARGEA
jgi:hypothetical protein